MKIEKRKIDELKEYGRNTKSHPEEQILKIANSIKEFGFNVPIIIDENNTIIAGHGRLLAAKQLKLKEVPCIEKNNLSIAQIKAYRIADNKTAESDWIKGILKDELLELNDVDYDMTLTGFDDEEINEILKNSNDKLPKEKINEVDKLASMLVKCPKCQFEFKKRDSK